MPKILVVDDSMPIRKYMTDCLNQLGFEDVSEAANGRLALDAVEDSMPDIITLDWNMPEMDGLEFLRTLRALPNGKQPVVIFCSTESSHRKIELVMASGANEYITKPFNTGILREKFAALGLL